MFGAQSIGEVALAASSYAIGSGGALINDGIAESFVLLDTGSADIRMSLGLAETTALGGLVQAPGLPLADRLDADLALDALFLPTALWTELPRGLQSWASVDAGNAGWHAIEQGTAGWTNQ